MFKRLISIIVLIFFNTYIFGCTSMHIIKHDQTAYNELNTKLEGKQVSIIMTNKKRIKGKNVEVTLNSLSWFETETNTKSSVPTAEVREIKITDHTKGASRGFIYGFLLGSLWPGLAVYSEKPATGIGIIPVVGLIIGIPCALLGLVGGHHDRNILNTKTKVE